MGYDRHCARRDRGARVGHATNPDADDRRQASASGGSPISLGLFRARERRCRQRSDRNIRRAQRSHHGNKRSALQRDSRKARIQSRGHPRSSFRRKVNLAWLSLHFSPTPPSASAAKPAKWRARNGTKSPTTECSGAASPTTTRKASAHSTWRHVLFLEQPAHAGPQIADMNDPFRWIFLSDVCKHCANAGCLEACPTGSIVRTEFGSVFVQPDVCNGCGYCVVSCPFGVIDKNPRRRPCVQMHLLLRPPKSGPRSRLRESLPHAIHSIRRSRRAKAARKNPRAGIAESRIHRRARVRSAANQRGRNPRIVYYSGRAGSLQSSPRARSSDGVFEERVDIGVDFGRNSFCDRLRRIRISIEIS